MPMASLSDIKALFYAARFFGCGPHVVSEHDVLLTSWGLAYSSLWAVGFACTCSYGMYLIWRGRANEATLVSLTAGRTLLAYLCFFSDGIISIKCNQRLRSTLLLLRSFDAAVGYNLPTTATCRLRSASCIAVTTVILFWLTVGFITYKCEMTSPLFNAIIYVVANAAISMQIIKFAGLLVLLHQRFRYLRLLLQAESESGVGFEADSGRGSRGRMQLQDACWLHCTLSNAADGLNSMYSMQLLFWLATMWLNSLSRIYAISENLAGTAGFLPKIREALLVTAYIVNLLIVTATCHFTAQQANSVAKAIFKPQTAPSQIPHSLQQTAHVGMYFSLRQLHFSAAAGFIFIDLPLLLSIAGSVTTYLVILHNNT